MTGIAVLFEETAETSPPALKFWAGPSAEVQGQSLRPRRPRLPTGAWPRPTLLSDPLLGQLVLASGGGMGWLGSTGQGLFTMADDLEQQ